MAKNRNFGGAKGVLGCSFIFIYFSHLNSYNKIVSNSLSNWKGLHPASLV
jgi:hypothetical protein